jgi:zinc transport system ATP-binding protein
MNKKQITTQNISLEINGTSILHDISFDIASGEYVGLVGPNGAGKSTLLKILLGLITPTSGKYMMAKKERIGYVSQHFLLPDHVPLSVEEVLYMGLLRDRSIEKNEMRERIVHALQVVDLPETLLRRNFHTLSGGQKQRIIIARAIMNKPTILFFDEPLSGVDYNTKAHIHEILSHMNTEHGTTIILVSHEIEHIADHCTRILCLNRCLFDGCHPVDFSHGMMDTCRAVREQEMPHKKPIHHHNHDNNTK